MNKKTSLHDATVGVYEVTGAQNVPGYSRYTYQVVVPGSQAATWTMGTGVTDLTTTPAVKDAAKGTTTNTASILWGEGAFVGTYRVTVADGFYVVREVNVVKIELSDSVNKAEYDGTITQGKATRNGLIDPGFLVAKAAAKFTVPGTTIQYNHLKIARLGVTSVVGPMGGRGVRFMELGLSQQGQYFAKEGIFDRKVNPIIRSYLVDGKVHWDMGKKSVAPWITKDPKQLVYYKPTSDVVPAGRLFVTGDNPEVEAVRPFRINAGNKVLTVSRMVIDLRFQLYFLVDSTDPTAKADKATIRASLNWNFDPAGNVDAAGVWTKDTTNNPFFGDKKFAEVKDGSRIPNAMLSLNIAVKTEAFQPKAK